MTKFKDYLTKIKQYFSRNKTEPETVEIPEAPVEPKQNLWQAMSDLEKILRKSLDILETTQNGLSHVREKQKETNQAVYRMNQEAKKALNYTKQTEQDMNQTAKNMKQTKETAQDIKYTSILLKEKPKGEA